MIGFDPDDCATVPLKSFGADKPEAERPRFKIRFLTSRQSKRIEQLHDEACRAPSESQMSDKLDEAIRIGIVGWENVRDHAGADVPFTADALDDLTQLQKLTLVREYPTAVFLAEGDRKNSAAHLKPPSSPPPAATGAASAPPAQR